MDRKEIGGYSRQAGEPVRIVVSCFRGTVIFAKSPAPMIHRSLSCLSLLCIAMLLSSCQLIPTQDQPPFGNLPPGVVRRPDGTLVLDPRGAAYRGQPTMVHDVISHWSGGEGNGPPRIRIDLSEQTAYLYRGSVLVGRSWLSTGNSAHPTPTGSFRILEKDKWHRSNRYGVHLDGDGDVVNADADSRDAVPKGCRFEGADMNNFMRLTGSGVGMHAGILPGYPASHSCIRMPAHMSEHFFNSVSEGTPVTIVP
jgi:L,D-transpeptidase catalytic domain